MKLPSSPSLSLEFVCASTSLNPPRILFYCLDPSYLCMISPSIYVFYYVLKTNPHKDFAVEVDKLSLTKARVQIKVDAAENNAEVLHDDVLEWRRKVQSMEDDKSRLLQSKDNLKCLDVCSRYRLGKEGKKKMPDVTQLIADGNNFDDVGYQRPLTGIWHKTCSKNYEGFQSRESVFEEIMKAVKDDGVYKIGIHGMPGVGKTRMMKEVAQQAKKVGLFVKIVEIVISQNPNLKDIQQNLAESLELKLNEEHPNVRKERLYHRLKNGEKILVTLDDVWRNEIKLEDIGIPSDDHTKGCKILLTSREQDVGKEMGVSDNVNFKVELLSEDEAWSLFEKKVGDSPIPCDIRPIAKAVCEKCSRLPLALLAVGGALQNKSKEIWEDARNSMTKNILGVEAKLYVPIEFSYNKLQAKDAKLIFLLCCLFPEDAEISIHDLMSYGFGMRLLEGVDTLQKAWNRVHTMVDILKISSLLLEGRNENIVKMHDVIREVAIWIAAKEEDAMFLAKAGVTNWPEENAYKQCKAISLSFNDDCVPPDDLESSELHTLMLEFRNVSLEVQSSFFKGVEKLQVLQLCNMQISELHASLKNLRMLRLYNCKLENVAFLKEFKKLEMLCIEDSDLRELTPEIGQLTRLRLLDVRYCVKLKIIPSGVIASLSQLEELYIPDEFDQWEVKDNASLNELYSLKRLSSLQVYLPDVMLLSPLIEPLFKSLNRFQISIGSEVRYREQASSATRILKVGCFPLKKELKILMEYAEVLYLEDLKENVSKGLFGSVSFRELRELIVHECDSMIHLFSSDTARSLLQLQKLSVSNCEIMEEIVRHDQEVMNGVIIFGHLKEIELKDLPKLRSFYANMEKSTTRDCKTSTLMQALFNDEVAFPALEELEIENLDSLATIWECQSQSQVSFQSLRFMRVWGCNKLVNVIASNVLPSLQKLENLIVRYCDSVEEIVAVERGQLGEEDVVHNEIIVFPQLKNLQLYFLENLKSFTRGSKEDVVHDDIIVFPQLKNLQLQYLPRVETLFNQKIAFPALEDLNIHNLESLAAIWEGQSQSLLVKEAQVSFQSLRFMEVWGCNKLVSVIASNVLPSLPKLEKLRVICCDSMEEIVTVERGQLGEEDVVHDEFIVFPQLKYLELNSLKNLKSFTHGSKEETVNQIIVLSQLKYLRLEYLPNLKSFTHESKEEEETVDQIIPRVEALFNYKVAFPALEDLIIIELESLTAIWNDQSHSLLVNEGEDSFRFLKCIKVKRCNKLVNVIPSDVLPRLQKLEKLKVDRCGSVISEVEVLTFGKGSPAAGPTIVLPQLKVICLMNLPYSMMYVLQELTRKEYSGRVFAYPNLKELRFSKCHSLRNVLSPSTTKYLVHLQKLEVIDCEKMEGIVAVERGPLYREEGVVHDDEVIDFPQLKHLTLEQLPNLNSFYSICGSEKEEKTAEQNFGRVEALFNYKVSFPALEKLKIKKLQSLTVIWDNQLFLDSRAQDSFRQLRVVIVQGCQKLVNVILPNAFPQGLMVFHSLKHLILIKCDSLRFLFSLSIARGLTLLKTLLIGGCSAMEQIVRSEGQGEEDDTEEIVFTRLNVLRLDGLPNLTCFCGTNNAFKFPSLMEVALRKCPQLQTFTTGCLSTPDKLRIDYEGGECNDVIDLNDYVQKFVRREKGLAVDESDDYDHDFNFGDFDYDDDDDDE